MNDCIDEYREYVGKTGSRLRLYRMIAQSYDIKSALYPGSHIDIDPSLVIENVTYVDNFKGAIKFFKKIEIIDEFLQANKEYPQECHFNFIPEDYNSKLDIDPVDLIISQYAGFVGQATKNYLKVGGILLCNDSHGDATLAKFDDDYKLIGTVDSSNKISSTELDKYFILPKNKEIDLNAVMSKMKGLKYTLKPSNYIFKKIR
jgi:inorganic pyrophosphatase